MKVALVCSTEVDASRAWALGYALRQIGHGVTYIMPDSIRSSLGGAIELPRRSPMSFSELIHGYLSKYPHDVAMASNAGYPLLVEQLAGGTPTVIRLEGDLQSAAESGECVIDDRQLAWSKHLLGMESVIRSDVTLVETPKEIKRAAALKLKTARILPVGIEIPPAPEETEARKGLVIRIRDVDAMVPLLARLASVVPKDKYAILIGSFSEGNSSMKEALGRENVALVDSEEFHSPMYSQAEAIFDPQGSPRDFLKAMSYGCPVICFTPRDGEAVNWPLWRLGDAGIESIARLPKVLEALSSSDGSVTKVAEKFAKSYAWETLVGDYIKAYQSAMSVALAAGRVRGW